MENTDTILCARVKNFLPLVIGTVKRKCDKCSAQVWFSPSAQQYEKSHKLRILCMLCGKKEVGVEKLKQIKLTPGQDKEIMSILRSIKLN